RIAPGFDPGRRLLRGAFELGEGAARFVLMRIVRAPEFDDFGRLHKGEPKRLPDINQALDKMRDMGIRMQRARRDAQSLRAPSNRRIIYGLDIDRMAVEQHVAGAFAEPWIADKHRHDMGRIRHYRQPGLAQRMFGERRLALMEFTKLLAFV